MNPLLNKLHPYPFERLRALLAGVTAPAAYPALNLSIGEPKHPTPALIRDALVASLDGLATYPATAGTPALRESIAGWLRRRYGLNALDAATEVLPVNGSREALFAFAQAVVDPAGAPEWCARIRSTRSTRARHCSPAPSRISSSNGRRRSSAATGRRFPEAVWADTRLLYACSPGNPTGAVMSLDDWRALFELSDQYGFTIASDECYSEIHFDEAAPPLGALQAAQALGRRTGAASWCSRACPKRSNAPGLRSGFVAGDATILKRFLLYRTYHGSAN
ncbi:MAG: aminotransferase class I/II-fold pyridoxal phosphate-dependent enzyme [Burkholderiaceae bacterium]